MKKIIFIAVALFIYSLTNAQTEKGHFVLGGDSNLGITFGSTTYKSDADGFEDVDGGKTTEINFKPAAGYFVIDNLALGLLVSISSTTAKDDDYKSTSTSTAVGPFIRYYFPMESVLPFITAHGIFGSTKHKFDADDYDGDYKTSLTSLGGGAGLAIPLSDSVTFDIIAGYSSSTFKDSDDNPDNERIVGGAFGVNFGLLVILGNGE